MKILKKQKTSSLYDTESGPSWAVTDPSKFRAIVQQSRTESQRAPEFWLKSGESKALRFLDEDAIATFKVYKFQLHGRWQRIVKPADGKPDLFASTLGLRSSQVFAFRLVDIEGYRNRQGKQLVNIPRFLISPARQYEQLKALIKEVELPINEFTVKMSRSGSGTNTTYVFIPKPPTPMPVEFKRIKANFPLWTDFYRPPSLSQQQSLLSSMGASAGTPDEDDE